MSGLGLALTILGVLFGGAGIGLLIGCMCASASRGDELELDLTFLSRSEW